jgi:hypothetical protein
MKSKWLERAVFLVFGGAVIFHLWVVSHNWNAPILDEHSFRQTHTAMTSYYICKDGFHVFYKTPIFGPPWVIPYEFPLYQAVVAALQKFTDLPLEQCGRTVNLLFFYLCLIPLWFIAGLLGIRREARWLTLALVLLAPIYMYWPRTFMMESTGLLLTLAWVAVTARLWQSPGFPVATFTVSLVLGCLASLVKAPTWIIGAEFLFLWGLVRSFERGRQFTRRKEMWAFPWKRWTAFLVVAGIALLAAMLWVKTMDSIKLQTPFPGARVTVESTQPQWRFGSWEQRSSFAFWKNWFNNGLDAIGGPVTLILALAAAVFSSARISSSVCLLCFLTAPLVFSNLYYTHNYYWFANSVYFILILGCVFDSLLKRISKVRIATAIGLCTLFVLLDWSTFEHQGYWYALQCSDFYPSGTSRIVRENTPSAGTFVLIEPDWNPELAYYARRKSIIVIHPEYLGDSGTWESIGLAAREGSPVKTLAVYHYPQTKDPAWFEQKPEEIRNFARRLGLEDTPFFKDACTQIYRSSKASAEWDDPLLGLPIVGGSMPGAFQPKMRDTRQFFLVDGAPSWITLALPPKELNLQIPVIAKMEFHPDGNPFQVYQEDEHGHRTTLVVQTDDPHDGKIPGLRLLHVKCQPNLGKLLVLSNESGGQPTHPDDGVLIGFIRVR